MRKLLFLALAVLPLSVSAEDPVYLCTFRVDVRIIVVNATETAAQGKLVQTIVEYQDATYNTRLEARARAGEILATGYRRDYYPPGGTATGVYEQHYGPVTIARVSVSPLGLFGDPANCIGQ